MLTQWGFFDHRRFVGRVVLVEGFTLDSHVLASDVCICVIVLDDDFVIECCLIFCTLVGGWSLFERCFFECLLDYWLVNDQEAGPHHVERLSRGLEDAESKQSRKLGGRLSLTDDFEGLPPFRLDGHCGGKRTVTGERMANARDLILDERPLV